MTIYLKKEINMEINNDQCYKVTKSHVSESEKISKRKYKDPFHLWKGIQNLKHVLNKPKIRNILSEIQN